LYAGLIESNSIALGKEALKLLFLIVALVGVE
jgi:hypothetical protein